MPGPAFCHGETVDLCVVTEADVDFLVALFNDPDVRASIATATPSTPGTFEPVVEPEADDVRLLICVDDEPVGFIGVEERSAAWGTAEVGYFLQPEHWGEGYATDALRAVCDYAFRERRFAKVWGRAYATNPASGRVMEKVGFTQEGTLRDEAFVDGERVDVEQYGLLADEFLGE